jgi:hypothetical protein
MRCSEGTSVEEFQEIALTVCTDKTILQLVPLKLFVGGLMVLHVIFLAAPALQCLCHKLVHIYHSLNCHVYR